MITLVGLVVEGEAGLAAIPVLLKCTRIHLCRPIKFNGQPTECNEEIFHEFIKRRIVPTVRAMILKNVANVIVVIDRETRRQCPGAFAHDIQSIISQSLIDQYEYTGHPPVSVVCADRMLENWIIADPKGILAHNYIVKDLSRAVGVKADGKDALTLLKRAYKSGCHYHKSMDAPKLAAKVNTLDPDVRFRSPSLDKLLRECGIPPLRA